MTSQTDISARLPGWRIVLGALHLTVKADSFRAAIQFVDRVADLAEEANHHPDIDLRYNKVHLKLVSHDAGDITDRDVDLAERITRLVDELGLHPQHSASQAAEIAIDTLDHTRIIDFWAAALGYEPTAEADALDDPRGLGPSVWFQKMDSPRLQRNRIHLDVSVPHDEAEARIAAVLEAGGHVVDDSQRPSFVVLGDADGNEVCICTWLDRGR